MWAVCLREIVSLRKRPFLSDTPGGGLYFFLVFCNLQPRADKPDTANTRYAICLTDQMISLFNFIQALVQ